MTAGDKIKITKIITDEGDVSKIIGAVGEIVAISTGSGYPIKASFEDTSAWDNLGKLISAKYGGKVYVKLSHKEISKIAESADDFNVRYKI